MKMEGIKTQILFWKGEMMKTWLRLTCVLFLAAFLVVVSTQPVSAAYIDDDGKIEAGEVIDDDVLIDGSNVIVDGTVNGILFAFGDTVTINGKVNGDIFTGGTTVRITDTAEVNGNVFAGAQTIQVDGRVTGSVFGGSASMTLEGSVGRNLYYGGFSFESQSGSVVTLDQYTGGYQALLAGEVGRDLKVGAGAVELSGKIGRNAEIYLDNTSTDDVGQMPNFVPYLPAPVQPGLRVAESAQVGGKLTYTSAVPQSDAIQGLTPDQVVYQTPVPAPEGPQIPAAQPRLEVRVPFLGWFFKLMRELVALLVFGGLALWLMPNLTNKVVEQARFNVLPAAGYGLLTILLGYFAAFVIASLLLGLGLLLALVTLGSVSGPVFGLGFSALGLALAVFAFLIGTGSKVVVSLLVGGLLVDKIAPQTPNRKVWVLLAGVFLYALIRSIPFIGWLVALVATLIGMGAMYLAYRASRAPRLAADVPAPEAPASGA